ncbi:MAG: Unknown protein [uncultured Thiotrichaceae bacterium]|uniref:PASTA domain-containing protein n=1 Tax=uncultured Thiotrichaceae bacterium TaxID=298394 RepID=A0A6S6SJL6_9GAMM|nr:MAG: Unknown protein [uncultured Thiotrichaceae bacterium]
MASNVFSITSTQQVVKLDANGQGKIIFTVFNASDHAITPAKAQLVTQQPEIRDWVTPGDDDADETGKAFTPKIFARGATQQYTVNVAVPEKAPAGKYGFRLTLIGVDNPDEDFTEGPLINFEVAAKEAPPPPTHPKPWLWIILGTLLFIGVAGGVIYALMSNGDAETQTVAIANYKGTLITHAQTSLEAQGFNVEVISSSHPTIPKQQVITQTPDTGSYPLSTQVQLTVSTGPNLVAVDNVVGSTFNQAKKALENKGFNVIDISTSHPSIAKEKVIKQTPNKGMHPFGTEITLNVSTGPGILPVKNVVGLTLSHAKKQLEASGFKVKTIYLYHETKAKNIVTKQSPQSGVHYQQGKTFSLTVSKGESPKATVYQHCHDDRRRPGYAIQLKAGKYKLADLKRKGINNKDISAIKTNGYIVTLYEGDNFQGSKLVLNKDDSCLVDNNFNDKTSSIIIQKKFIRFPFNENRVIQPLDIDIKR